MKKSLLLSVAAAALVISGCAKKTPEVDLSQSAAQKLASQIQSQVQNVYFDYDKFSIRSDMKPVVDANADLFKQPGVDALNIKVEGNCDEWGSDEYNYALGLKRATAVKDALVSKGVSADQISVVSYGESNPVCQTKTKDCDAKNRRDEFKISVK